jgi:hypothetical protein
MRFSPGLRRAVAPVGVLGGKARQFHLTKLGLTIENLSHRRETAVLTFLRDAGLRA